MNRANYNPHVLSDREKEWVAGVLNGKSPTKACIEAGYDRGNLRTLIRRAVVRSVMPKANGIKW